jgi:hypothetical protein
MVALRDISHPHPHISNNTRRINTTNMRQDNTPLSLFSSSNSAIEYPVNCYRVNFNNNFPLPR